MMRHDAPFARHRCGKRRGSLYRNTPVNPTTRSPFPKRDPTTQCCSRQYVCVCWIFHGHHIRAMPTVEVRCEAKHPECVVDASAQLTIIITATAVRAHNGCLSHARPRAGNAIAASHKTGKPNNASSSLVPHLCPKTTATAA